MSHQLLDNVCHTIGPMAKMPHICSYKIEDAKSSTSCSQHRGAHCSDRRAAAYHSTRAKVLPSLLRQFQAFVDRTPQLTNGLPYLTCANIDTFFLVDVAKHTVCGKTVGKIFPALVWYSRHCEHINESFNVESEMTKRASAMQEEQVYLVKLWAGPTPWLEGQHVHYS
jgi:hypothetical protein